MEALINIVGGAKQLQKDIKDIILNGLVKEIHLTKQAPNYAEPKYRIQLYDLPSDCPRQGRRRSAIVSDIGYIKASFFNNLGFNKPAVTLFIFDYRDFSKEEVWDWRLIETSILGKVKNHSDHWQKDLSVPSKYVLIILFPLNVDGVNPEDCR